MTKAAVQQARGVTADAIDDLADLIERDGARSAGVKQAAHLTLQKPRKYVIEIVGVSRGAHFIVVECRRPAVPDPPRIPGRHRRS